MGKIMGISGNVAIAHAVRLADVDVVSAYPITPQTTVVEKLSEFVAEGLLDAEFIKVESEHSALSACIGASAAGSRAYTSTCGPGLALMHELLWVASGLRLPIVMSVINRSYSAPISIWSDHCDSLAQRDSGWVQIYCEDCQEAFDTTLQAFKIAENEQVLLPVMVGYDGYILSHLVEPVEILNEEEVKLFLPPYKPRHILTPDNPVTMGPIAFPSHYFEFKRQQEEAMVKAKKVITEVGDEYGKLFGRRCRHIEKYRVEDAEVLLLTMGSITGTARLVIDKLRKRGKAVGLIKLRTFRPFPTEEIKEAARNSKVLAVVDKNISFGAPGGIVQVEVRSALYKEGDSPHVMGFITGLGGRDVTMDHFLTMAEKALKVAETDKLEKDIEYIGVRG